MPNLFSGNPALFLFVWLLVYALMLFTLSALYERHRSHNLRKHRNLVLAPAAPPQRYGRRAWLRRHGNPTAVLIAQPNAPDWQAGAWVINRSQGGIRLTASQPFETGQPLRVLSKHAPNNLLWADVEVRNCREGNEGYEVGCQFAYVHPLSVVLLFG
jgi:PilZ domain